MRPKTITLAIVCAGAMAGLFGPGRQASSGPEPKPSNAAIVCCNQSIRVPETPEHKLGTDHQTPCRVHMEKHPEWQQSICEELKNINKVCPDIASYCSKEKQPPDKPGCQKYSGEITCDCNGDGQDETTKSFESCGRPANWPTNFRSRCEDWVNSGEGGGYSYATDIAIQREGSDYLKSLYCPALKCYRKYKTCQRDANDVYDKCSYKRALGKHIYVRGRDCLADQNTALNQCAQNRDKCLDEIRKFGPGPRPQPLPEPPGMSP